MSRILIVEDDPAILCGLRDNLEFESHQVLTATDGEAGYRSLCEHTPDLVILDLMLPKLNGYDLCRRVRGEGFNAPILMLSARSQEGDRVLGLDLGANDYVSKPFSLRELLARVRALLRHEQEHLLDEERLAGELKMAEKVQRGLFPRVLPAVPGLDYAGVCRPARGVSGDYYDFLPLAEGRLGMLLADVSGKGMSAALLGASLHAAVRSNTGANTGESCGELLARINGLLFETTTADRYATVFYGVYDPATRVLDYANAGHYPPMVIRHGACLRLDSLTPPVAMPPVLPAVEKRIELLPGDWLLIFSDGIPEATDENDRDFADEGLLEAFRQSRHGTATEVCESVVNAVRNHARGRRQADDLTLIAARVSGERPSSAPL
ncbi:putative Phosphoserine phosphatase [Candidatus Sulfopaludibacter sp. SbA6]|nr:putative Phosphoserine phosphatase [Candidatus Sulfopaludibacter sp. SbA6]